jgi:hypothetical protein
MDTAAKISDIALHLHDSGMPIERAFSHAALSISASPSAKQLAATIVSATLGRRRRVANGRVAACSALAAHFGGGRLMREALVAYFASMEAFAEGHTQPPRWVNRDLLRFNFMCSTLALQALLQAYSGR